MDLFLDHKLILSGGWNATPAFKTDAPSPKKKKHQKAKQKKSKRISFKKGLKTIFEELYNCTWVKDKEITISDWSVSELSLRQVKYAALDAWVSFMIGVRSYEKYAQFMFHLSNWNPTILEKYVYCY